MVSWLNAADLVFDVLKASGRAVKTYQPQACLVRTVVFRAAEQADWAPRERSHGWSEWVEGPLAVQETITGYVKIQV